MILYNININCSPLLLFFLLSLSYYIDLVTLIDRHI